MLSKQKDKLKWRNLKFLKLERGMIPDPNPEQVLLMAFYKQDSRDVA